MGWLSTLSHPKDSRGGNMNGDLDGERGEEIEMTELFIGVGDLEGDGVEWGGGGEGEGEGEKLEEELGRVQSGMWSAVI